MFNFINAKIKDTIVHYVGNKLNEEELIISAINLEVDAEFKPLLINYFLTPFNNTVEFNRFFHESDLNMNEIYNFSKDIFFDNKSFLKKSQNIAKHLYSASTHSNIKGGELYIAYFNNCIYNDELIDIIGIFKSETKEPFMNIEKIENDFKLHFIEGISLNKIDKGCLILNTSKNDGFRVCIIDNVKKNSGAQYWKDDFLKIEPCVDNFHQTKNFLTLTKQFVVEKLDQEFDITKTEKIDYLNRSIEYFKSNEQFNETDFANDIFEDNAIADSFKKFKKEFQENNELDISDEFSISDSAVKKQSRIFKSVLKLDKNFHIYIHGNRELIEQGVEKDGRKFYKIYFQEES